MNIALMVGVVGSIGWGMWYFSDRAYDELLVESAEKLERAVENTRKVEGVLETTQTSLARMNVDRLNDMRLRFDQDVERAADRKELVELRSKLDSYRKRWENVAFKKPGLLARVVNRATIKRMRIIEAATCRTNCSADKDADEGAKSRQPAR